MRLIYLSHDELNLALVNSWAARKHVEVRCPSRLDLSAKAPKGAVLLDVDHVPLAWVESVLGWLGGEGTCPVAAHGYGSIAEVLRSRGVVVHPRLRGRALAEVTSGTASLGRAPERETSDELTCRRAGP
jgi:hypothetical protein